LLDEKGKAMTSRGRWRTWLPSSCPQAGRWTPGRTCTVWASSSTNC
jgi:hypothetical protein